MPSHAALSERARSPGTERGLESELWIGYPSPPVSHFQHFFAKEFANAGMLISPA